MQETYPQISSPHVPPVPVHEFSPEFPTKPENKSIQELPLNDRPREKLLQFGADALSNSELLAILLRTGIPGCNALTLAQELIQRFGSLRTLSRAALEEITALRGIGPSKAMPLICAFTLATRLAREQATVQTISTARQVYDFLGPEMQQLSVESLRVLLLDTRHHLIRVQEVSRGSINESIAHPREIIRPAILHSAYAIILVHNHPSGDPSPSSADIHLTRRILQAGKIFQIPLLDHIIIGYSNQNQQNPYYSFQESGTIPDL